MLSNSNPLTLQGKKNSKIVTLYVLAGMHTFPSFKINTPIIHLYMQFSNS